MLRLQNQVGVKSLQNKNIQCLAFGTTPSAERPEPNVNITAERPESNTNTTAEDLLEGLITIWRSQTSIMQNQVLLWRGQASIMQNQALILDKLNELLQHQEADQ